MATKVERADVKALIRFYEKRGWDWSMAAEFLLWKYNGGGQPRKVGRGKYERNYYRN